MRKYIYILNIALAFGFVACDKTEVVTTAEGEGVISFAPQTVKTRALINSATDLRDYTLKIWDIWSGQTTPYIDNTLVYSEDWQYGDTSDAPYFWKAGTHKFFSCIDGTGTYAADGTLSVSKTLTTAESDQVDILYSDLFVTTAQDWKNADGHTAETPVPLNFKHMLSAVAVTVKNCSENEVILNSVSKPAIPNKGSATVDYSGDVSTDDETNPLVPTYGEVSVDVAFVTATALSNVTLSAAVAATEETEAVEGGMADVLAQAAATENGYWLVWPQTIAENTIKITVNYTMNSVNYEKEIALPATTWERGNKYTYTLQILPTDVRLKFDVMPWLAGEAGEINTSSGSINMSNVTWMNSKVQLTEGGDYVNTLNNGAYSVTMFYKPWVTKTVNGVASDPEPYDGFYPAQAYFTVNYPLSGQFKIGLIPAYGQDSVDKSKFEIWVYKQTGTNPETNKPIYGWVQSETSGEYVADITHDTIYFQIRAAAAVESASSNPEYRAQLDIWFMPDGADEWISAYSEVRANYAVIIPAR